jgi:4a-hydroxytetrahydrobiopterin dehydratase
VAARPQRLDDAEAARRIETLAGWTLEEGTLHKRFRFEDFSQAFGWMTRVALVAERMDHHPDWQNVYDRVDVHLTTHDAGGLTLADLELAAVMDQLAG